MEHPGIVTTAGLLTTATTDHTDNYNVMDNFSAIAIPINLRVRPQFFLFAEVSAILCVIFGVIGNVLTIVTIAYTKKIRDNSNNVFVLNMAVSDCLFCAIVLPFTALKYHTQSWSLPHEFCEWLAFFKFAFTCMSLLSLCNIALNRYVYLVHSHLQTRIFTQRNVTLFIAVGWIISVLLTILPIVKLWGYYGFDPEVLACTFTRESSSYRKFIVALSLFVPFLFMIVCYSRICMRVYKVQRQVKRWSERGSKKSASNVARRENLQLTTTMILIFLLHGVSCLPYTCVGILDPNVKYPVLHIITPPIAWLQFVLNPLVYTIANLQFRRAYKVVILKAMCRNVKVMKTNDASNQRSGQNEIPSNATNIDVRPLKINESERRDLLTLERVDSASSVNYPRTVTTFNVTPGKSQPAAYENSLLPASAEYNHANDEKTFTA